MDFLKFLIMNIKRVRERGKASEEIKDVEDIVIPEKLYRKTGGGTLVLNNRFIKPGQLFWAKPNAISKAFMDTIEEMDEQTTKAMQEKKDVPVGKEEVYTLKQAPKGKWNVVNGSGKAINSTPLSKEGATELKEALEG